jgi:BMFP domain-containing protein YqiC
LEAQMQSQNRLFDDFVKMMNGAAGTFAGMTREAEGAFRERARDWVGGLDMVSRDEFEAVKAIAVAAREEASALRARLDALETAAAIASGPQRSEAQSGRDDAGQPGVGGAA